MGYCAITCCYRSCASVNAERVNTRLPVLSVGALTSACDAIESALERVIDLRAVLSSTCLLRTNQYLRCTQQCLLRRDRVCSIGIGSDQIDRERMCL